MADLTVTRSWQESIADLADEPIALVADAMYAVHGEDYEPFMAETAVAALAEAGWLRRDRGRPS